jgi:alpha-N-arabinofuranosidase
MQPTGSNALWFAKVDATTTTICAQFRNVNPNEQDVEINVRQTVFTPSRTGINYLTVRGFELRAAAAPWSPPTAAQIGIITAYWCKGWIIEDNRIRYSPGCGVALGKYGDEWDNGEAIKDQPEWLKLEMQGGTGGYVATTERALTNGWNKATIGSHLVRNNEISHCEQTGIVGSLGCAFSTIVGNEIHDIHVRNLYGGYEMAGIKFHGAIDVVISGNHIYRCNRSLWLDWMCQGSQIVGNLMHDSGEDIFLEMQHGPQLVANNLLLSKRAFNLDAKGMAFTHNLIAGDVRVRYGDNRTTPFQTAHHTRIAGMHASTNSDSGDHRFYNNLFVGDWDGRKLDKSVLPCFAAGNAFTQGAQPSKFDAAPLVATDLDAGLKLEQKSDGWYLTLATDKSWRAAAKTKLVTTELLGKAQVTGCAYENRDASPLKIATDYFGKKRPVRNPFPGPFENVLAGKAVKVWPPKD